MKTLLNKKEVNATIKALAEAKATNTKPSETASKFIEAVGTEKARQALAAVIKSKKSDGRISAYSRKWAESVESYEPQAGDYISDGDIHPAHLDQIAQEMPKALEKAEEAAKTEQPAAPRACNAFYLNNGYIAIIYSDGSAETFRPWDAEHRAKLEEMATKLDILSNILRHDVEPKEREQKESDANFQTCKRIAYELEAVAGGNSYKCPHCGEVHDMDDYEETEHENEDGITCYTCPHCGEEIEESDLEACDLYDYLNDALDYEFTMNGDGSFHGGRIAVGLGGPSIYIDTDERAVCLYWWGKSAQFCLNSDTVNAVDDYLAEIFESVKG